MMVTLFYILIFFLHWLGDFVLQTRKMADNKSSSIKWLTTHVGAYTLTLLFAGLLFCLTLEHIIGVPVVNAMILDIFGFVILNGLIHWIVDFFTSKLTTYYYNRGNIKTFFTTVGFDQLLHSVTLLITFKVFFLQ